MNYAEMNYAERIERLKECFEGVSAYTISRMAFMFLDHHAADPCIHETVTGITITYHEAGENKKITFKVVT